MEKWKQESDQILILNWEKTEMMMVENVILELLANATYCRCNKTTQLLSMAFTTTTYLYVVLRKLMYQNRALYFIVYLPLMTDVMQEV